MATNDGTRLERLQASQDRLLRYAHFRLGEELMKSHLGASNLPTAPSSPGVWDVEYSEDHAEALGLEPNSYDVFKPEPDDMSRTIHTGSSSSSQYHAQSILDNNSSSILPTTSSSASLSTSSTNQLNQSQLQLGGSSTLSSSSAVMNTTSNKSVHFGESSVLSNLPGNVISNSISDSQLLRVDDQGSAIVSVSGIDGPSSSLRISQSMGVLGSGTSATDQLSTTRQQQQQQLRQQQQQQQQQQPGQPQQKKSHGKIDDAALLSRADSAMQFFMKRSQIIDPPVQALLTQVKQKGKTRDDGVLASVLRAPPSHSYGTKKGYRNALQKQKNQRIEQRRKRSKKNTGTGPTLSVFRSTSRLREILDSKPQRRKPRRLASLAHSSKDSDRNEQDDGIDSTTLDTDSSRLNPNRKKNQNNGPRVLNSHLNVPNALIMKEPVFLPLEWFDSGVTTENNLPYEYWVNMNGKSRW
jgi:hypothetical protein